MQPRRGAEANVTGAGELQRALVATEGELDLFKPGRRVVDLDLSREAPRRFVAFALLTGRRGQRHRAVEARRAGVEIQNTVEIGRERPLARIDVEVKACAVAVGSLPRGNPKRIARALKHEVAVAAKRAGGERAHVAAED